MIDTTLIAISNIIFVENEIVVRRTVHTKFLFICNSALNVFVI